MRVKATGRKVNLKDNFIAMVEKRMAKFDRFFDEDAECQVTVTVEKDRQTAEVTVKSRGFIYRAEQTASDMETAFSDAADQIGKQIVKNKEKLGARIKRNDAADLAEFGNEDDGVDDAYHIVREKVFSVKPMLVEEAVLQMNMLNHSFYAFLNADTDSVCVVYRRNDEDYGLLIPEV
jgi:putative sigma-54 modulation protein